VALFWLAYGLSFGLWVYGDSIPLSIGAGCIVRDGVVVMDMSVGSGLLVGWFFLNETIHTYKILGVGGCFTRLAWLCWPMAAPLVSPPGDSERGWSSSVDASVFLSFNSLWSVKRRLRHTRSSFALTSGGCCLRLCLCITCGYFEGTQVMLNLPIMLRKDLFSLYSLSVQRHY